MIVFFFFISEAKQVSFQSKNPTDQPQYTFYKKRNYSANTPEECPSCSSQNVPSTSDCNVDREDFKFNFPVDNSSSGQMETPTLACSEAGTNIETNEVAKNYFKMETSDSNFSFNFDVSDKT